MKISGEKLFALTGLFLAIAHSRGATFSDANWISLNPSIPGADSPINAAVVDSAGNLYIGGFFRVAGGVAADRIAKWNGSSWAPLGSGVNGTVSALAVSG